MGKFKSPHWTVWYVWFIIYIIKFSDILRTQPNSLWTIINYGSGGKWQENKYFLFHQEEKYRRYTFQRQSSDPNQGVQLLSRPSAPEMIEPERPGAAEDRTAPKNAWRSSLTSASTQCFPHLCQPFWTSAGRQGGGDGRGAWHHLVLHL